MTEKIKDLITRIEQLESESDESIGAGIELGKLYSKMREMGYSWNTRIKLWQFDENSEEEE